MPQYPRKRPRREIVIGAAAFTLVLVWYLARRHADIQPATSASAETHRTYFTNFPLTEKPILEDGNWINGRAVGIDWADIRTTPAFAFGTESGDVRYDDSTALLTGAWGPNQTAQATVHTVSPNDKTYEEVELRLRSTLSAHKATGYEINFRCSKTPNAYTQIVRWNGRFGSFTILKAGQGSKFGVADGDVVRATIVGNVIKSYINGVQMLQTTDDTYQSGNPGMGFYLEGATGVNADFGFTRFAGTDGPPNDLQAHSTTRGRVWRPAGPLPDLLGRSEALLFSR